MLPMTYAVRCDGCGKMLNLGKETWRGELLQNRRTLASWLAQGHRHACSMGCVVEIERRYCATAGIWEPAGPPVCAEGEFMEGGGI